MNVLLIFLPTKTLNCCDKRKHNVILELPTEKNCENQKIRGGSRSFWWGVDDTNRPSNYTLIYSKLSYLCPKTWRISKGNGWLASEGFRDPRISVCFSTYYIFIVGCSKGGGGGEGVATQSTSRGCAHEDWQTVGYEQDFIKGRTGKASA